MPRDESGNELFFGEDIAAGYDEGSAEMFRPEVVDPAVDVLAELAGDGRALEFAIGTGRLAIPLAARGVPVVGIDNSEHMVARLRDKPEAQDIEVTIGDIATTRVDGEFRLVWPAQLDLMARIAGMTLESRWSNWQRESFTAVSRSHVSVWAKV